jgi:hypothetical protein
MPDLGQIPVPQYSPDQPYHWEYDNVPLQALAQRDEIINGQVDIHAKILSDCNGTQGTLANRLAHSIDPDGSLITSSVDSSLHNIGKHTNGSVTVSTQELSDYSALGFPSISNPVSFVRMLQEERSKLQMIASEATNMAVAVETISNIIVFDQGTVQLGASSSIGWEIHNTNVVTPVLNISTDFSHRHYYDINPVLVSGANYKVTSSSTNYIQDSLRVYINGVRLSATDDVYYPSQNNNTITWTLNRFTPNNLNGTFSLETSISTSDVIKIDFDLSLT